MAVASNVLRSVLPTDTRALVSKQNAQSLEANETNALTVNDEIKDLEMFIDDMCNHDDLKTIELYDRMSLELKAEVSFLRKLNQATLLQDVTKNQTNNSLLRDEVMQLRHELRAKNNFIDFLCSPQVGATLGPEYQQNANSEGNSPFNLIEADPNSISTNDSMGRSSIRMFGASQSYADANSDPRVEVVGDFMLNNIVIRELNKIHNVKVNFIYGCMAYDLVNHVQRLNNVSKLIIHVGSNDAADNNDITKNVQKITKYMKERKPDTKLMFSSVIIRKDREILGDRIRRMNEKLEKHCEDEGIGFIDNSNIDESSLDVSKVHLNKKGNSLLAKNILTHILDETEV